jgi:hypothetical protein
MADSQPKDALTGKWLTTSGDARVQIYPVNRKFLRRIIWLKKPNDNTGKPE